jgi:hypothetical protein
VGKQDTNHVRRAVVLSLSVHCQWLHVRILPELKTDGSAKWSAETLSLVRK